MAQSRMHPRTVLDWMECLFEHGWYVRSVEWFGMRVFEWRDPHGCSGTDYHCENLSIFPAAVEAWIAKMPQSATR